MPQDFADRHVERWRDHWIDIPFDDDVEAMTVRVAQLNRAMRGAKKRALPAVELQDAEYETLHQLMIRDTPGQASPGALAAELEVSGAGMTGRLDALEKRGYVKRMPGAGRPAPGRGRGHQAGHRGVAQGDGAARRLRGRAGHRPQRRRAAHASTGC